MPSQEIACRPYIDIEDYVKWRRRRVPGEYLSTTARHRGISVKRWNEWIEKFANDDGKVRVEGLSLGAVQIPYQLCKKDPIAIYATIHDAEKAFAQRTKAIRTLLSIAQYQPTGPEPYRELTARQRHILEALNTFGPMPMAQLCIRIGVRVKRRTMYNPGGINELMRLKYVDHPANHVYRITKLGQGALEKTSSPDGTRRLSDTTPPSAGCT